MEIEVSDEADLIERIRSGDDAAFDAFVRRHYPALCRLAARITQSFERAEDVVVEVLAAFWDRRGALQNSSSVRGYLYRAVHNRALSARRDDRRRQNVSLDDVPAIIDQYPDAMSRLGANDLERALEHAVAALPDRCRTVYILSREDGLSYAEIGEVLGISVRTVDAQLCKALARIRQALAPHLR